MLARPISALHFRPLPCAIGAGARGRSKTKKQADKPPPRARGARPRPTASSPGGTRHFHRSSENRRAQGESNAGASTNKASGLKGIGTCAVRLQSCALRCEDAHPGVRRGGRWEVDADSRRAETTRFRRARSPPASSRCLQTSLTRRPWRAPRTLRARREGTPSA